jgi:hypothetical protein
MRKINFVKNIAMFLALLIISIPFIHAEDLDLWYVKFFLTNKKCMAQ